VTEKETEAKRTVFSIHSLFIHKLTQKENGKKITGKKFHNNEHMSYEL